MKSWHLVVAVICAALPCIAQSGNLSDWPELIGKCEVDKARALCSGFVDSKEIAQQVEAQKCLANVALCGNDTTLLEGDDSGGGSIRGGYKPEATDEALLHLNNALKLAPQDLTIHMGRLHVLEVSGRYDDLVKALDESCATYHGREVPQAWLAYAPELMDLRQYRAGLEFMKVLNTHYPNNADIVGNIGAFLALLARDPEAIEYLKKATDLAPKDPINAWDLAREYDYAGQTALADQWYGKALSLMTDTAQRKESSCTYAEFIEKKLKDRPRACTLQKQSCPAEKQTACAALPSAKTP
ncbi:MAG: hypothetical protein ACLQG3_14090 [Terracidiphilus sp.]